MNTPRFHPPRSYVVRTRKGFDARCYRLRADDWNALGELLCESSHRTLAAAEKAAMRFHKSWGGELDFSHRP
jgi:hypothetical protein